MTAGEERAAFGMSPGVRPGDPITVAWSKFDGSPHWTSQPGPIYLGEDEFGWWYGQPPGTRYDKPTSSFISDGWQVGCWARGRLHTATFYEPVPRLVLRLYVDVTTAPRVVGDRFEAVDLDLDVCQRFDGSVYLDDEDEFVEHQGLFGYPPDLVAAAQAEAAVLLDEVTAGAPRFAESLAERWRAVLRSHSRDL